MKELISELQGVLKERSISSEKKLHDTPIVEAQPAGGLVEEATLSFQKKKSNISQILFPDCINP